MGKRYRKKRLLTDRIDIGWVPMKQKEPKKEIPITILTIYKKVSLKFKKRLFLGKDITIKENNIHLICPIIN